MLKCITEALNCIIGLTEMKIPSAWYRSCRMIVFTAVKPRFMYIYYENLIIIPITEFHGPPNAMHEQITLTTPALLFSAISLILLAYTNRFLGYATLIRGLHEKFKTNPNELLKGQIANLRKRLYLTKNMQVLGVTSLFLCVGTMFLIFVGQESVAVWIFGVAMVMMIASLGISIYEIQISVRALDLHLGDMEQDECGLNPDPPVNGSPVEVKSPDPQKKPDSEEVLKT